MGKREWFWKLDDAFGGVERQAYGGHSIKCAEVYALIAIAERLEALVAIGDALEEVGDLWANTLAFGGQPVGEIDEATRSAWMCNGDSKCVLMKDHGGEHVHASKLLCQCIHPDFEADGVCRKCGYPEEAS